jgi:hypothetical protein
VAALYLLISVACAVKGWDPVGLAPSPAPFLEVAT